MMKKIGFVLFFIGLIIHSYSQSGPDSKILEVFRNTVNELENSIPSKGDIYGFGVGIKVSYKPFGSQVNELYPYLKHTALLQQAKVFASNERFDRFNLNAEPNIIRKKGIFVYQAGAFLQLNLLENTDKPEQWESIGNEYSEKVYIDGKLTSLIIHVYAISMVQKPNDGAIGADVYYYDKNGQPKLWQSWGTKSPQVAYTRMGPGNEGHNSLVGENEYRLLNGTYVGIGNFYPPGHYLPVIKFRGCTQDFRNESDTHSQRIETVLKLEKGKIDWSDIRNYTFVGKTAFTNLEVVQDENEGKKFLTYFSKGNIIEGQIKNEEKKNVEAVFDVVLEPAFEPAPFKEKKVKSDKNGYYRFNDIESGVYNVYIDGYKDKSKTVDVCNCPQKNESYNYTYTQDINLSTGYNVYAHYHSDNFADAEVVWKNVKIVIPEDKLNIKTYNSSEFKGSDEEVFEQMKSLEIPYALNIAGYGKEYFFSQCENEYETPEEVSMKLLSGEGVCFIDKSEDALNMLSIEMTPENPNFIKLVLQFDMYIGESNENSMQMTVCTDSEFPGGTAFYWEKLDEDIIRKLQAGEYAQKTLTNSGGCKLTITFNPN